VSVGNRLRVASMITTSAPIRSGSLSPMGFTMLRKIAETLVIGVSHDTPAFAAHAIADWWQQEGSTRYRGSRQLLILADTSGSNSCPSYASKTQVQFH